MTRTPLLHHGVCNDYAVATGLHGHLEGGFCGVDERAGVVCVGRHHGNAHAERGRKDSFAVGDLELRDFVADAFGAVSRDVEVGARHDHAEHVVGVAARDVFATDVARQALPEFPEELFHGMAAVGVLHSRDGVGQATLPYNVC